MKTEAILRKKNHQKQIKRRTFLGRQNDMKLSKGDAPVVFPKNIKFYIIFIKININVNSNSH